MNKLLFLPRHRKKKHFGFSSGLTLIECLVAIAVIAATSATIAPVIVLSVATRVQNQKSEQALQLAQGEIDRVRLLVERNSTYTVADLKLAESTEAPLSPTTPDPASKGTAITTTKQPGSLANKAAWSGATYTPSAYKAREIDTNGDGTPDFVIQSFRGGAVKVPVTVPPKTTGGTPTSGEMPVAFDMGVRVYDYAAITGGTGSIVSVSTLRTDPAGLAFTSGEGQRGRRPLAVLYSQITNSDNSQSLCEYMKYLRKPIPSTMSCPP